jgi:hypothetical protein
VSFLNSGAISRNHYNLVKTVETSSTEVADQCLKDTVSSVRHAFDHLGPSLVRIIYLSVISELTFHIHFVLLRNK